MLEHALYAGCDEVAILIELDDASTLTQECYENSLEQVAILIELDDASTREQTRTVLMPVPGRNPY